MSTLADRVRSILQAQNRGSAMVVHLKADTTNEGTDDSVVASGPPPPKAPARLAEARGAREGGSRTAADLEGVFGGAWREVAGSPCFIVDSRYEPLRAHGHNTVGELAARLGASAAEASVLAGFPFVAPFLFFDLETTGLSGGAGSYAFLVGFGWFDQDGGFSTRQFVLLRSVDERALLGAVARELSRAGGLVSFNGRSFDAPVLETRFLYHRLPWDGGEIPHFDMLPVARRFWRRDEPEDGGGSCSLSALELPLLGYRRCGDVPGIDIPGRYFQFVRTSDPRPLSAVFEHNRLDLLSLAALTARALHLVRTGPQAARDAREALALGWIYNRAGLLERAAEAYRQAAGGASRALVQIEALKALAVSARRARLHDAAAEYWRRLLGVPGCPAGAAREASQALAIHNEHRLRDLVTARTYARRSLGGTPRSNEAGEYRLRRIEQKLKLTERQPEFPSWLSQPSCGSPTSARRISS